LTAGGPSERDRNRREFVAEADEILDTLSEGVRDLEEAFAAGRPHQHLINALFRGAHTLKGFAGLLGFPEIASLTHALEDLLARLRRGDALDGEVLDLLHDTLDALIGVVREMREGSGQPAGLDALARRLAAAAAGGPSPTPVAAASLRVPDRIRASLTEHEEARLEACLAEDLHLTLVRVHPELQSLDEDLQEMARRVGEVGELISTLPVVDEDVEGIVFDLLVASRRPLTDDDLPRAIVQARRSIHAPIASASPQAEGPRAHGSAPSSSAEIEEAEPTRGRGVAPSMRVSVSRLDEVLSQAGELSIAVASLEREMTGVWERHPEDRRARRMASLFRVVATRLRALQRGAIETRLVPLEQEFRKVGRAAARAARASGREVDLATIGADTEIDKSVMDGLSSPLMHLVVNAVDHGIETPVEREGRSKPRRGRVVLNASRRGPSVVIEISDDGRGIVPGEIQAEAERRGLWPAGRTMTRSEAHEMIFSPGFSTAGRVSEVSGRGVGMDVVRRTIRSLKGSVHVRSVEGEGTTFTVVVPISLALVPALIVHAAGRRFAIPIAAVHENLRLDPSRIRDTASGRTYQRPEGDLPLLPLDRLLGSDSGGSVADGARGRFAVVAGEESRRVGLVVDGIVKRQEVVVKPIGRLLRDRPGVAGATDLGDATAVLVLDPDTLVLGVGESHVDA